MSMSAPPSPAAPPANSAEPVSPADAAHAAVLSSDATPPAPKLTPSFATALSLTAADLTAALGSATFGMGRPVRWVIDADDERVGWLRDCGVGKLPIEWRSGTEGGWVPDEAAALAKIEVAALRRRELEAIDLNAWVAMRTLPEPLRSLRMRLEAARVDVEVELQRNIRRPHDLALRRAALSQAETDYAEAERARAA